MAWGLVATVKAPLPQIEAFLAHHLDLGAARITLFFDAPDDPALAVLREEAALRAVVKLVGCDAEYWARHGTRPERHQNRQARNCLRCYRASDLDWLGHIDIDEFLLPSAPVSEILASAPPDQVMLRAEPFEAMHDAALEDDIFTARHFRGAFRQPNHHHLRPAILGPYAALLPLGLLSHSAGKAFFRTGIRGLQPRLHGAFLDGERLPGPDFDPRLRLLHFHAQNRAAWLAALPFRLTRGAYQYHPELQAHLATASPEELATFYEATQCLNPEKAALLAKEGRLVAAKLDLRAKRARVFGAKERPAR